MSGQDSAPDHVSVLCPICETSNFFPASQAGQTHPCDFCGNLLTVPEPPPEPPDRFLEDPEPIPLAKDQWWRDEKVMGQQVVKATCPLCETLVSAPVEKAGQEVPCPDCGCQVKMPQPVDDPRLVYGESIPYAVSMDRGEEAFSAEPAPAAVSSGSTGSSILDRVQRRPPPEPTEPPPPETLAELVLKPWLAREIQTPQWHPIRDLLLFPWTSQTALVGMGTYWLIQAPLLLLLYWFVVHDYVFAGLIQRLALVVILVPLSYVAGGWFVHLVERGFEDGPQLASGVSLDPGQWLVDTLVLFWYMLIGVAATVALTFWFLFFLSNGTIFLILLLGGYLWVPLMMIGAQVNEKQAMPLEAAVFQSVLAHPGTWLATWLVPPAYLAGLLALLEVAARVSSWAFWALLPVALSWWFMLWGRWVGWCGSQIAPFLARQMLSPDSRCSGSPGL